MIGLTGGIGSGKSTIAQELARRGYVVYDCDKEAKRIIAEDEEVKKAIIHLLGNEAFKDGKYNTTYVAKRVFDDPEMLKELNAIVHPAVKADIALRKPDFVESAILHEAGLDILCDKVIVVDAPEKTRIDRVIARDYNGMASQENIAKIRARIDAQKTYAGNLILCNDGKTKIETLVDTIIKTFV